MPNKNDSLLKPQTPHLLSLFYTEEAITCETRLGSWLPAMVNQLQTRMQNNNNNNQKLAQLVRLPSPNFCLSLQHFISHQLALAYRFFIYTCRVSTMVLQDNIGWAVAHALLLMKVY